MVLKKHACRLLWHLLLVVLLIPAALQAGPKAVNGELDLRGWQFASQGPVALTGEWRFFWQQLPMPSDIAEKADLEAICIPVPGFWFGRTSMGAKLPAEGYGTYRLRVRLPVPVHRLKLRLQEIHSAFRLYVNGEYLASLGRVGMQAEGSNPEWRPVLRSLHGDSRMLDIVLQVSNFHFTKGGIMLPLQLGLPQDIDRLHTRALVLDSLFLGVFLVMAAYHLGLFLLNRTYDSALYFAALCLVIAVRHSLGGSNTFLLFSGWSGFALAKLRVASFLLAVPIFIFLVHSLFRKYSSLLFARVIQAIYLVALVLLYVLPGAIANWLVYIAKVISLCGLAYVGLVAIKAMRRRSVDSYIFALGFVFLSVSIIHDMLLFEYGIGAFEAESYGMLAFMFCQAFLLSLRFSRLFKQTRRLSLELESGNERLRREITEKRRAVEKRQQMVEQIAEVQKMELMGNLAGGIAHDFNNILSGIIGTVSLLKFKLSQGQAVGDKLKASLNIIDKAADRAAQMVKRLLAVSRRHSITPEPTDLNQLIQEVVTICRNTLDKRITIESTPYPGTAMANIDSTQMQQLLLNLCVNAEHAMTIMRDTQAAGGTLRITLDKAQGPPDCATNLPECGDNFWHLSVADTGVGMSESVQKRAFEPYFTTKDRSLGTGLGLAIVFNIVNRHQGCLTLSSAPGRGTTFHIYLPALECVRKAGRALAPEPLCRGEGLLLLIDDDALIRDTTRDMLRQCGFQVLCAQDGKQGLELFEQNKQNIKLVLLDQVMPGMSGLDTMKAMQKQDPMVRVLIISGMKQNKEIEDMLSLGALGFLAKPYSLSQLAAGINQAMAQPGDNTKPAPDPNGN